MQRHSTKQKMQDINKISHSNNSKEYFFKNQIFEVMDFKDGIDNKIMDTIINTLLNSLEKYSKILMIRLDIHLKQHTPNNQILSKFKQYLVRHLLESYCCDVQFMWVREQTSHSNYPHYHCFVLLNQHKVKNSWSLKKSIEYAKFMTPNINSYEYYPENNAYILHRSDCTTIKEAVYRCSYLAKNTSKEYTPTRIKRYQASHSRYKRTCK